MHTSILRLQSTVTLPDEALVSSFHTTLTHAVIGLDQGQIYILDAGNKEESHLKALGGEQHPEWGAVWALRAFEHTLLSGGKDGNLRVWDMTTSSIIYTLRGHTSTIRSLQITPDNRTAISGSADSTIRVWDIQSGACVRVLPGHQGTVRCLQLSNESNILISGSYDGTAKIWSLQHEHCLCTLPGHSAAIAALLVADGKIYTASLDKTIRVWDAANGASLAVLQGHTGPVNSLHILHDKIISSSADGWIRTWSLPSPSDPSFRPLWSIKAHDHAVTALHLHDTNIISGGKDGGGPENTCGLDAKVRIWPLDTNSDSNFMAGEKSEEKRNELGTPAQVVWRIKRMGENVAVVAMKRGKITLEIWGLGS